MEKVVRITDSRSYDEDDERLNFWMSKSSEERIEGLEYLRRQRAELLGVDYDKIKRVAKIIFSK